METIYDRTKMLLGGNGLRRIQEKKIVIFGLGGAGSHAAEALARAGVGTLALVDYGQVSLSDVNRQITALHSTLGRNKTEVMAERIADIDPQIQVRDMPSLLNSENIASFSLDAYDYVIDALDHTPEKIGLIEQAEASGVPIISVMSTGDKFDPGQLKVGEIRRAKVCPMAKVIKKALKAQGICDTKVVYSTEIPHREESTEEESHIRSSISFVPATAGILAAAEAVKDLLLWEPGEKAIFGIKVQKKQKKIAY